MHLDYMNDLSCSRKKCPRKFITSKTQNKSWKDQNPFFLIGKKGSQYTNCFILIFGFFIVGKLYNFFTFFVLSVFKYENFKKFENID